MVPKDCATHDTIQQVHLYSDMPWLLTSIISLLLLSCGGLQTNALELLILCNKGGTAPLDISLFTHSHLSEL